MAKPQDKYFPAYRKNKKSEGKNVQIKRIAGSNMYYVTWHTHSKYQNSKITKQVKKDSKSNKKQTKKISELVSYWEVRWFYQNGDSNTWIPDKVQTFAPGVRSSIAEMYTKPSTATAIRARVSIISKRYEYIKNKKIKTAKWFDYLRIVDKKKVNYHQSLSTEVSSELATPSVESFTIDNTTAKVIISYAANSAEASLNDITKLRIRVLKDGTSFTKPTVLPSGATWIEGTTPKIMAMEISVNPNIGQKEVQFELSENGSYQVQAIAGSQDDLGKNIWSEWTNWSSIVDTRPVTPTDFTCEAYNHNTIRARWSEIKNVEGYIVEYLADDGSHNMQYLLDMFNDNIGVNTVTADNKSAQNGIVSTLIPGLEKGYVYYFRIRSFNNTQQSDPSDIVSAIIATKPSAPTTWSSATTITVADEDTTEPAYLYWTHNSVDGSAQRRAGIELTIGDLSYIYYKDNTETDEVTGAIIDKISEQELWSMPVNIIGTSYTTVYDWFMDSNSNTIKWRVRTRGIGDEYSDWSIERTINAYIKPTLSLTVSDVNVYPIVIDAVTTPASQTPISYYVSIVSLSEYDAVSGIGEDIRVQNGTEVFARNYDTNEQLHLELNAFDVDLEPGNEYELNAMVYMDSGLTAEATPFSFIPEWVDVEYEPTGYVEYNDTYKYANIYPECLTYIGADTDRENISYFTPETVEHNTSRIDIPSGAVADSVLKIGGKSLVWNQLIDWNEASDYERYGITGINNHDGSFSISGANTDASLNYTHAINVFGATAGHKYYVHGAPKGGQYGTYRGWIQSDDGSKYDEGGSIIAFNKSCTAKYWITVYHGYAITGTQTWKPRVHDLTQMFGAGNEPTSVDDPRIKAIEEYAELHPEYNAGEIISSQTDALEVRGKNIVDISEANKVIYNATYDKVEILDNTVTSTAPALVGFKIKVEPNTIYNIAGKSITASTLPMWRIREYSEEPSDFETGFIGQPVNVAIRNPSLEFTATARTKWVLLVIYFNVSGVTCYDIQVEKGSTPTPYKPYTHQTIPTNLPVLRSAGNGHDERVYGDVNKQYTRFAEHTITASEISDYAIASTGMPYVKTLTPPNCKINTSERINAITSDGRVVSTSAANDKAIRFLGSANTYIYDSSFTSLDDAKSKLDGVKIVYELAEPIITDIDPIPQLEAINVEAGGQLTFVDHSELAMPIPTTHEYIMNNSENGSSALTGDVFFSPKFHKLYVYETTEWVMRKDFGSGVWYTGDAFSKLEETDDYTICLESGVEDAAIGDYYFDNVTGDIYRCITGGDESTAIWSYICHCLNVPTDNVLLRVFRREKYGDFVEITTNEDNVSTPIDNDMGIFIRDPHPTFGMADYRIIAIDKQTGSISYNDISEEVYETSVFMQWEEVWNDDESDDTYTGSILEIPANIKISDSSDVEAMLANYIGRGRPVSYYGTQKGQKLSVTCEFDKTDTKTLENLRRLMVYSGDVYVREPSGLGYWAKVNASYVKEFKKTTIPVTFDITPVEGGK